MNKTLATINGLTVVALSGKYSDSLAEFSISGDLTNTNDGKFWYADVYFTETGNAGIKCREIRSGCTADIAIEYAAALTLAAEIAAAGPTWAPAPAKEHALGYTELQALNNVLIDQLLDATLDNAELIRVQEKLLSESAEVAALMDSYRDLVVIFNVFDKTATAGDLAKALNKHLEEIQLNNAGATLLSRLATLTRERDDALAKLAKREAEFLKLATESEGYREALEGCIDSAEVMRRALDHKGDKSLSWTVEGGIAFMQSPWTNVTLSLLGLEVPAEVEEVFSTVLGDAPYHVTISKIPGGAK